MNITQYIENKPELRVLDFKTVYQTITTLIGDGVLSMDDFKNIKSVSADGFYKFQKKE